MRFEHLQFDLHDGVARLTLNRPDKLNSFNSDMHAELRVALDQLQDTPSARVLVLTGAGRAFCAGQDLADPAMQAEYREGCARSAQRILQDAVAQATTAGVACETVHVAEGYPAEAVVKAATEHGAGLVVMASHGRRGLGRMLLGSQTQAVLVKSTVPVLVVR